MCKMKEIPASPSLLPENRRCERRLLKPPRHRHQTHSVLGFSPDCPRSLKNDEAFKVHVNTSQELRSCPQARCPSLWRRTRYMRRKTRDLRFSNMNMSAINAQRAQRHNFLKACSEPSILKFPQARPRSDGNKTSVSILLLIILRHTSQATISMTSCTRYLYLPPTCSIRIYH